MGNSRAPTFREHDTRADTDVSGNHNTLTPNGAARAALAREAPGVSSSPGLARLARRDASGVSRARRDRGGRVHRRQPRYVRAARPQGTVAVVRVGRRIVIPVRELERYLNARRGRPLDRHEARIETMNCHESSSLAASSVQHFHAVSAGVRQPCASRERRPWSNNRHPKNSASCSKVDEKASGREFAACIHQFAGFEGVASGGAEPSLCLTPRGGQPSGCSPHYRERPP